MALYKILAAYSAGEEIGSFHLLLEDLIDKYEIRQAKLAAAEQPPDISPLAIDIYPYQYEECVQVIGLCILLHRTDLLSRFVMLIDNAGYAGDDTLYEDLLCKVENALRTEYFKEAAFNALLISYTAGEPIDSLIPRLEKLISRYEIYQQALAVEERESDISPLAIDDWPEHYEECIQVISLYILLHRTDLLTRVVALIDRGGYADEDTLYEDLLRKYLPGRVDLDEWFHVLYTPLIRAIYATEPEESSHLLKHYCETWYPAFATLQTNWHDSHLDIEDDDGNYVAYWAFEAGAIAFLYGIDDSQIDHMVYPKDLVEYARNTPNK